MRFILGMASLLFLVACDARTPAMTDEQVQKLRREVGLTDACAETMRWHGTEASDPDKCIERRPAARWSGLWRDGFEGQFFCPAPARACPGSEDKYIWLEGARRPAPEKNPPGGLYAVEFVGRISVHGTPMRSYGAFYQDIEVDRMISIKRVDE